MAKRHVMKFPLLLDAPEKDERLCQTFPFPIERGNQGGQSPVSRIYTAMSCAD